MALKHNRRQKFEFFRIFTFGFPFWLLFAGVPPEASANVGIVAVGGELVVIAGGVVVTSRLASFEAITFRETA